VRYKTQSSSCSSVVASRRTHTLVKEQMHRFIEEVAPAFESSGTRVEGKERLATAMEAAKDQG
jgi:hypothetical protein